MTSKNIKISESLLQSFKHKNLNRYVHNFEEYLQAMAGIYDFYKHNNNTLIKADLQDIDELNKYYLSSMFTLDNQLYSELVEDVYKNLKHDKLNNKFYLSPSVKYNLASRFALDLTQPTNNNNNTVSNNEINCDLLKDDKILVSNDKIKKAIALANTNRYNYPVEVFSNDQYSIQVQSGKGAIINLKINDESRQLILNYNKEGNLEVIKNNQKEVIESAQIEQSLHTKTNDIEQVYDLVQNPKTFYKTFDMLNKEPNVKSVDLLKIDGKEFYVVKNNLNQTFFYQNTLLRLKKIKSDVQMVNTKMNCFGAHKKLNVLKHGLNFYNRTKVTTLIPSLSNKLNLIVNDQPQGFKYYLICQSNDKKQPEFYYMNMYNKDNALVKTRINNYLQQKISKSKQNIAMQTLNLSPTM